jgi:hypothetical protein
LLFSHSRKRHCQLRGAFLLPGAVHLLRMQVFFEVFEWGTAAGHAQFRLNLSRG